MTLTPDELVERARQRIRRVEPHQLAEVVTGGGLVVDIRPAAQRSSEGEMDGAVVIERNVLEWRLDPSGASRIPEATGFSRTIVIVCSEGYASSLAADSLLQMGYGDAADLVGGYLGWRNWKTRRSAPTAPTAPSWSPNHVRDGSA